MTKGLKALEDLMSNYYEMCEDTGNNDDQYQRCNLTSERAVIEKELERLENYDALDLSPEELQFVSIVLRDPHSVTRRVKAFETIKEKNVDIQTLKRTNSVIEYNSCVAKGLGEKELTQEEYDFLKEMLS